MIPYWLLFAVWAAGALQYDRPGFRRIEPTLFVATVAATALMIGLRYEVGGDWQAYLDIHQEVFFLSLGPALRRTDSGYAFLDWMGAQGEFGVWFVNLGCAILFMAGVGRLAARQPNPWLAMLVAVPYLVIVVAMGYTRQAAAIGIICWAIADAAPDRLLRVFVLIGVAALFHKTAILFLPIVLAPVVTRNLPIAIIGALVFALVFNAILGGESDRLITNYVNSDYNSQGAGVRIAMNVLAAGAFLLLRNRMGLDEFKRGLWTICAVLALASVAALVSFSASSGVDRMALFLIPLQVIAFSRLPYALSASSRALPSAMLGVLLYSGAVQFVWLTYGDNATWWLPYRTVLLAQD